jgi:hypothetical protein
MLAEADRDPSISKLLNETYSALRASGDDELSKLRIVRAAAAALAVYDDHHAIDDLHNVAVDIHGIGADLATHVIGGGLAEGREQRNELERAARAQQTASVAPSPKLKPIELSDFLALQIPPREMVLAPIIPEKGLAMLYAARGVGKTHVAHGIAFAVAAGGKFLRWSAPRPRRVLCVGFEVCLILAC